MVCATYIIINRATALEPVIDSKSESRDCTGESPRPLPLASALHSTRHVQGYPLHWMPENAEMSWSGNCYAFSIFLCYTHSRAQYLSLENMRQFFSLKITKRNPAEPRVHVASSVSAQIMECPWETLGCSSCPTGAGSGLGWFPLAEGLYLQILLL